MKIHKLRAYLGLLTATTCLSGCSTVTVDLGRIDEGYLHYFASSTKNTDFNFTRLNNMCDSHMETGYSYNVLKDGQLWAEKDKTLLMISSSTPYAQKVYGAQNIIDLAFETSHWSTAEQTLEVERTGYINDKEYRSTKEELTISFKQDKQSANTTQVGAVPYTVTTVIKSDTKQDMVYLQTKIKVSSNKAGLSDEERKFFAKGMADLLNLRDSDLASLKERTDCFNVPLEVWDLRLKRKVDNNEDLEGYLGEPIFTFNPKTKTMTVTTCHVDTRSVKGQLYPEYIDVILKDMQLNSFDSYSRYTSWADRQSKGNEFGNMGKNLTRVLTGNHDTDIGLPAGKYTQHVKITGSRPNADNPTGVHMWKVSKLDITTEFADKSTLKASIHDKALDVSLTQGTEPLNATLRSLLYADLLDQKGGYYRERLGTTGYLVDHYKNDNSYRFEVH